MTGISFPYARQCALCGSDVAFVRSIDGHALMLDLNLPVYTVLGDGHSREARRVMGHFIAHAQICPGVKRGAARLENNGSRREVLP